MADSAAITSLSNPLVRRIRRLQTRARSRRSEGAFFVEGVSITLTAFEAGATVEAVVYAETLLADEQGREALEGQRAAGAECVAVSERVFRHLSQRNNPDGLGAVCRTTWRHLDGLVPRPDDVFVAVDRLSDPGNLGTILRTMDSVGAGCLILVGESSNPFHPRTVRSSRGTVFTVPLCACADMDAVFSWTGAHGVHTVATSAKADCSYRDAAFRVPVMFIFGNEHRGLDAATLAAAEQAVTIPMSGRASSLNVAVAVGLLLYETSRGASQGPTRS